MFDMSVIVYFESGKRLYKDLVSNIDHIRVENRDFIQITFLNVNSGLHDIMVWPATQVSRISCKIA